MNHLILLSQIIISYNESIDRSTIILVMLIWYFAKSIYLFIYLFMST